MNPPEATPTPHRTWAEIDPDALRHNLTAVRSHLGPKVAVIAVVKANAYGHGARTVATTLAGHVDMFGVANITEALEIREVAPEVPVLILGPALPEERANIVTARFIPTISNLEEAAAFSRLAGSQPLEVHLKLDTGMGRIGISEQDAVAVAQGVRALPGVRVSGLATHFPVADEDDAFTLAQIERFDALVSKIAAAGISAPLVHSANSAGIIAFPTRIGNMARPGLMLYGVAPRAIFQTRLRPAMTWKTRVVLLRDIAPGQSLSYGRTFTADRPMRVATLGVGYADGYRRHLSNRGAEVLIGGRRCSVLGRVTMDQILADVTAIDSPTVGDEVVLMGRHGNHEITATELATRAGTIAWDIFTGIGPRVARVLKDCGQPPRA